MNLKRNLALAIAVALFPADGAAAAVFGLFLGSDDRHAEDARELQRGAEIAFEELGGPAGGRTIRLITAVRPSHWQAGAGELVRLVYDENILVALGPTDSRTAHLAEQVAARAKGRFLLLAPWATDPALTRIKVPWFFRLAPDDCRQAEALLDEIHGVNGLRRAMTILAEADYDSRTAAEAFERAAAARGALELKKFLLPEKLPDPERLAAEARAFDPAAVLFFAPPEAAARALRRLREEGIAAPAFGPLGLATPAFFKAAGESAEGMVLAAPPEPAGPAAETFRSRYREKYGGEPGAPAAFGYDGAAALLDGLRVAGNPPCESMRRALANLQREGLTGRLAFDAGGNRLGAAPLSRVEKGRLRPLGGSKRCAQTPSNLHPLR
ncbi:MAG: ABC transporter substrate-binding protein [Planctomycetes bacterium]|nr:ABC transporter substrate-binding protein [Planctomycetota bacterium]